MLSITFSAFVLICTFGASLLGMLIAYRLPNHHLNNESREVIKVGTGLIGTMAALVLGLMVASAKTSYDNQRSSHQTIAMNMSSIYRALNLYGPEAREAQSTLKKNMTEIIDLRWPKDHSNPVNDLNTEEIRQRSQEIAAAMSKLNPANEEQKNLKSQVMQIFSGNDVSRARWMLGNQGDLSIPIPFLGFLVFWLSLLFLTFGLLSPRNLTVTTTLFLTALAVSSAVFLIMDLDQPTQGIFQITPKESAPLWRK